MNNRATPTTTAEPDGNPLAVVYAQGRLVRKTWSATDSEGRQLLCLLTALAGDPDVRPGTCPASVAPAWLAYLLPWIDDAGSATAWRGHMDRLVPLAPRLHMLGRRAEQRCKLISVLEARSHTKDKEALAAVDGVVALLNRSIAGDEPTKDEWAEARWAAARWEPAVAAVAAAARWEPVVAAAAAHWAALAAARWAAARWAEAEAEARWAEAEAADRMIAGMITVFEDELAAVEGGAK